MAEIADSPSLAEQVIAFQSGSTEAFNELHAGFYPMVFGIALRSCRNRADAEDITQIVFKTVFTKIHQLDQPESFPGWIKRIATRLSINYALRLPSKETPTEYVGDMKDQQVLLPDVESARAERAMRVRALLAEHSYSFDRDAIIAFYFEGLSLIEMSQRFNAPIGTIKRRLHTARSRLRVVLEENGMSPD